jgi:hemerythrin superfamily protein
MATSKRAPGPGSQPLALELLAADHRKVDGLFRQFEQMKEDEDEGRVLVAQQICNELTIHAQIEEDLFYPWLRENLEETDAVAEATVEHQSLKQLVAEIQPSGQADEAFDARVKVLSEYVKHHVKEEENEIFPQVAGEEEELDELGQELAARKAELMAQMGIEEDAAAQGGARREQARNQGRGAQRPPH